MKNAKVRLASWRKFTMKYPIVGALFDLPKIKPLLREP